MRKLVLETDSQHNTSIRLYGYEPPNARHNDAGGSSDAPLLAHLFIEIDRNYLCILPSRFQDPAVYKGQRGPGSVTPPSTWERREGHYVISPVNSFADRLYRELGWEQGRSYSIPGVSPSDESEASVFAYENNKADPWAPRLLIFDLGAATPLFPDEASSTEAPPRRCF